MDWWYLYVIRGTNSPTEHKFLYSRGELTKFEHTTNILGWQTTLTDCISSTKSHKTCSDYTRLSREQLKFACARRNTVSKLDRCWKTWIDHNVEIYSLLLWMDGCMTLTAKGTSLVNNALNVSLSAICRGYNKCSKDCWDQNKFIFAQLMGVTDLDRPWEEWRRCSYC